MPKPEHREWPVEVIWTSRPGIPGDRIIDAVYARTADEATQAAEANWPTADSIELR